MLLLRFGESGRGSLPRHHPQHAGPRRRLVDRKADLTALAEFVAEADRLPVVTAATIAKTTSMF